jgi:hypothetical protein
MPSVLRLRLARARRSEWWVRRRALVEQHSVPACPAAARRAAEVAARPRLVLQAVLAVLSELAALPRAEPPMREASASRR